MVCDALSSYLTVTVTWCCPQLNDKEMGGMQRSSTGPRSKREQAWGDLVQRFVNEHHGVGFQLRTGRFSLLHCEPDGVWLFVSYRIVNCQSGPLRSPGDLSFWSPTDPLENMLKALGHYPGKKCAFTQISIYFRGSCPSHKDMAWIQNEGPLILSSSTSVLEFHVHVASPRRGLSILYEQLQSWLQAHHLLIFGELWDSIFFVFLNQINKSVMSGLVES